MAIAVAATSIAESASAASLACNVPTGTTTGDLLIAFVVGTVQAAPATPPTGWTLVKSQNGFDASANNGSAAFWRAATASEPASYTFTSAGAANRFTVEMVRLTGVDTANPFDVAAVSGGATSTTSYTEPTITTANANVVLLHCMSLNASTVGTSDFSTIPSGLTREVGPVGATGGGGRRAAIFSEPRPTAGATGTRAWTAAGTAAQWASITVALEPSLVATPPAYSGTLSLSGSGTLSLSGTATGGATPFASLVESFDSGFGAYSDVTSSTIVGGRARITVNTTFPTIATTRQYTLKGSQLRARVYPGAAGGGTDVANGMSIDAALDSSRLNIVYWPVTNQIRFGNDVSWSDASQVVLTYDPVAHAWWGFRESGGQTYFETSPDGINWTVRKQIATPSWIGTAADQRSYFTGYRDAGTVDYYEVDSVNVTPAAPPSYSGSLSLSGSGSLSLSGTSVSGPALLHRIVGVPSPTSGKVAVRTSNASSVRLKVGTNSAVTTGVIFGPAVTPSAQGNAHLTVSGLTPGTKYYYRVAMTGTQTGTEVLDSGTVGTFKSAPLGRTSFSFNFGSCTNATDSASFTAIAARGDDLFFHLGDLYYADTSGTDVANIRNKQNAKIEAPNHAAVFSTTATAYTPSDHDAMNNNTAAGSDPTAWTNWNQVYRELWPTPTLPGGTTGAYFTFTWGRVRFIQIDTRSFKSDTALTDNASKTALGTVQKQWLKDTITAATEPAIVILQADPWIGAAAAGDDGWFGFTTERTELGNFFSSSGKPIVMLGGDMHAVAADNGTNAAGGITVFQAAPFNNATSQKGGPYSVGPYPASGTAVAQQYGHVDVVDNGTSIDFAFTGLSSSDVSRVTMTKTFTVAAGDTLNLSGSGSLGLSGFSGSSAQSGSLSLSGSGSLTLAGKAATSGALALSGSGTLDLGQRLAATGSLSLSGSGSLSLKGAFSKFGTLDLSGASGSLQLAGTGRQVIIAWRALEPIYAGEGAEFILAYVPGNLVPDSAVTNLGVADKVEPVRISVTG